MTRRLVLAIVATVVASLVLAGLGTLVLARSGTQEAIEDELAAQAEAMAAVSEVTNPRLPDTDGTVAERFEELSRSLADDGVGLLVVLPDGSTVGAVPEPVALDEVELDRVLAGETVVGSLDGVVYAIASAPRNDDLTVVIVLTREERTVLASASRWFLVAAAATVVLAAAVAVVLGRGIVRPVRDVGAATERIAAGDLAARLPDPAPRARDELAELTRSVNTMAEALERSRGLEQQFLLSVSHDLRTPLTSIRGYAEAIADGAVEPDAAAATILSESRRLQRLVQDLLDLANLDARTFSLHPEPLDVAEVAAEVVSGVRGDVEAAAVDVGLVAAGGRTQVVADRDRLAQVVANLVENALKYAATRVEVSVEGAPEDGGQVVVAVSDDGPGIAAEDVGHVFERLYVAEHRPVRKEVGSGLGLAIVRDLTTAMGGSVSLTSAEGEGTTIRVALPAAAGPVSPAGPSTPSAGR